MSGALSTVSDARYAELLLLFGGKGAPLKEKKDVKACLANTKA